MTHVLSTTELQVKMNMSEQSTREMTSRCKGHGKKILFTVTQIMNQLPTSIHNMNQNQEPGCNVLPAE